MSVTPGKVKTASWGVKASPKTAAWGLGGGGNPIGHGPREERQGMNPAPGSSSFPTLPPQWLSEKAQQKLNTILSGTVVTFLGLNPHCCPWVALLE